MKKILNFGIYFMVVICGICTVSGAYAKSTRDQTLDYLCRPRWDKFIVDEKTTMWDRDSLACYDRSGKEVDVFKMYGQQSLYGEFDESGNVVLKVQKQDASHLYGDPAGINARNLYGEPTSGGTVKVIKTQPKPTPVRVATTVAPKPAQVKPVVKKSEPKPAPTKPAKPTTEKMQVVWVEPIEDTMPAPKPKPKPVQKVKPAEPARNIAHTLNTAIDVDSYCTEINPAVKGPLPKGLVLMTGRPDQMSCVRN